MDRSIMEEHSSRMLFNLMKELKTLCLTNIEYFQAGMHSHHAKFHVLFSSLYEYIDMGIEPSVMDLTPRLNEFDISPQIKGNGYRSLLRVVQKCCLHLIQLSRHIIINRDSMLFRRAHYCKELEAYVSTMGQLRACLYYAQQVMNYCQEGMLFSDEDALDASIADKLMLEFEMLNQDCFYGRCLGFQFCESMQRPLQILSVVMASFSEGYQENSNLMQLATSLFNSGKYFLNPDLRGKQVVNVTRSADVKFCKAFWSITESDIMHQLPSLVCPTVEVDELLQLGPDSFEVKLQDGSDSVLITPPCAHTGPGPVQVRLLSYHLRDGQQAHIKVSKNKNTKPVVAKPKSSGLLIHCHGGGFVAQSSKSHEVYLRDWARELNVPILSVDYSLAPEHPFPRALEECFYAYAWAVENCDKLGSTGKRIILAGDSAGGNLIISTAMRAASFGIRCPDGILGAYPVVLTQYTPSPSRLLALMDPLLPVGILSRCLGAYAGVSDELLNGLLADTEVSSNQPYKMDEDDSSDTEWVIISQDTLKKKKKKKMTGSSENLIEEEKEEEGSLFTDSSPDLSPDDFQSACQTPQRSESYIDEFSEAIGGHDLDKGEGHVSEVKGEGYVDEVKDLEKGVGRIEEVNGVNDVENEEAISSNDIEKGKKANGSDLEKGQGHLDDSVSTDGIDLSKSEGHVLGSEEDLSAESPSYKSVEGQSSSNDLDSQGDNNDTVQENGEKSHKPSAPTSLNLPLLESVLSPLGVASDDQSPSPQSSVSSSDDGSTCDTNRQELSSPVSGPQRKATTKQLLRRVVDPVKSTSCPDLKQSDLPGDITIGRGCHGNDTSPDPPLPGAQPLPRARSNPSFQANRPGSMSPDDFLRHRHLAQSPLKVVRHLPIVKNPYMSPLLAPDDLLLGLPEVHLVACHLDPLLDDSVMFTKRLRQLGMKCELNLIDNLPHGFLNFSLVSRDAKKASDLITDKLKQLFNIDTVTSKVNLPV